VFIATVVISTFLAALIAVAAVRKLGGDRELVDSYVRLGVSADQLVYLALVLLVGAAGLIVGLVWAPIGVVAAVGLIGYFVGAICVHVRAGDARHTPTPLAFGLLAALSLTMRIHTW
jgi:hypothetical protein